MSEGGAFGALFAGARAAASGKKRKASSSVPLEPASRRSVGSSFEACPVCGKAQHHALLEAHARYCEGGEQPLPAPLPEPVPSLPAPVLASSAFSVLLASAADQRVRSSAGVFALTLVDGRFTARWSATAEADATPPAWKETVDVRDKAAPNGSLKLTLTSNVSSADAPFRWPALLPEPGERLPHLNPSQLKSAVQKCVRLCLPAQAVRCAGALGRAEPSDCLRRLSVIAIEDSVAPPDLPLLVWLMVAMSKRYEPRAEHWAAVLQCVHRLASVRVRDPVLTDDSLALSLSLAALPDAVASLSVDEATMVRCLLLRQCYGGMGGDVKMLQASAATWVRRFSGCEAAPPLPSTAAWATASDATSPWSAFLHATFAALPVAEHVEAGGYDSASQLSCVRPLRPRDVPLSAFDFHCTNILGDVEKDPRMTGALMEALQGIDDTQAALRTLIWEFRRCTNLKVRLDGRQEGAPSTRKAAIWAMVHPLVESHASRYLQRGFS